MSGDPYLKQAAQRRRKKADRFDAEAAELEQAAKQLRHQATIERRLADHAEQQYRQQAAVTVISR